MVNRKSKKEELIQIFPPRKILFRAHGTTLWRDHSFTILGNKSVLEAKRSSKPMYLLVTSDVEGFRSSEILGFDLFFAMASALLTIESTIFLLQRIGEVHLSDGLEFNAAENSVFYGDHLRGLHKLFLEAQEKKDDSM